MVSCGEGIVTRDEVLLVYGRAVYLASVLEKRIAAVVSGGDASALGRMGRERYAFLLDEKWDGRFRRLVDSLAGKMSVGGQLETDLRAALKNRNNLLLEFWWEHADELETQEGCRSLHEYLAMQCALFNDLLTVFTPVL